MRTNLTEEMILSLATSQSYERGQAYFRSEAIFNTSRQGNLLLADCEGSSAPVYHLRVELDESGVRSSSCTCQYDYGGVCKHIVALLLTFLRRPETFTERESIPDLLAPLEKEALVALVARLVQRHPDLYTEIERGILIVSAASASKAGGKQRKGQPRTSEAIYRNQVKEILAQYNAVDEEEYYDDYDDEYEEGGNSAAYLADLDDLRQGAEQLLTAGNADEALTILKVLLEETIHAYDGDLDYSGEMSAFIQSLGMPLAEAVLSQEMGDRLKKKLRSTVEELWENWNGYAGAGELAVVLAALDYGWGPFPAVEVAEYDYVDQDGAVFAELEQARLNVLERQGRVEDYMKLAKQTDPYRYTLKLLELGRPAQAVTSSQELSDPNEILDVAQKLCEVGQTDDALSLAERGLEGRGDATYDLAAWLAPLEEASGRKEPALKAYRAAYEVEPSLEHYRRIKRMSGQNWDQIRRDLWDRVSEAQMPDLRADLYLEEGDWDAAIALAEKMDWDFTLIDKVADAVIAQRPDWVILISLRQSAQLIERTQSNLYPIAAEWLARAKKAYQVKGQIPEWQAYISNLRTTYARRPALQREIAGL